MQRDTKLGEHEGNGSLRSREEKENQGVKEEAMRSDRAPHVGAEGRQSDQIGKKRWGVGEQRCFFEKGLLKSYICMYTPQGTGS